MSHRAPPGEGDLDLVGFVPGDPGESPSGGVADISGPLVDGRGWPFGMPDADEVAAHGYVMEEFIARGTASSYPPEPGAEPRRDGRWSTAPGPEADYVTRFVVVRPSDPAAFNGVLLVNWQNVSAGMDLGAPSGREVWRGYAWVGVTAQRIGVDGTPATSGLRDWDPARYGELEHPGDAWSYGIFTQVARAVSADRPGGALDPLRGLMPRVVIAQGASQSACRLASYINGVHAHERLFDGFLLSVHFSVCVPPDERPIAPTPGGQWIGTTEIRADCDTPVMVVNSETEAWSMYPFRQPDTDGFRFWEIAGGAHTGGGDVVSSRHRLERDGVALPVVGGAPVATPNALDWSYVSDAATRHLVRWITDGTPPPTFPPLEVEHREPHDSVVRDERGVARGGLRMPDVEAPVAVEYGANARPNEPRILSGERRPFDSATLTALYPDPDSYLHAWDDAVDALVTAGGALPEDAGELRARGRRVGERAGVC
jgi:hypothetical protein